MGVYDVFGAEGAQLKAGPCEMTHYGLGDACPGYPNGVYLSYEGAVVISGGVFIGVLPLFDKWGGELEVASLIGMNNPVIRAINDRAQHEKRD